MSLLPVLRVVALVAFAGLVVLPDRHGAVAHAGGYLSAFLLVVVLLAAMRLRLQATR